MGIQSIRCAVPCCARAEEEQTTCSLITRIAAVFLGSIALLVGILALSGIPGLNALGTVGGAVLTTIGGLILLAGFCLRCVKENRVEQSTSREAQNNNDPSSVDGQKRTVDLGPIFHQGETWLDDLVNESADYVSLKLIITVKTKEKIITEPHIVHCIPDSDITIEDANFAAKEQLKLHISQVFQSVSLFEKQDPDVIVSFTLLTKSNGNQFGLHHRVVNRGGVISSLSNPKQSMGADKDFASVFKTYRLKVERQLDDSYNFI